jgi:hypothetical protein
MVDLEDPYLYNPVRLFDFHDTPTANNALAWARKVCNHVRQYVEEVARLFGRKPVIYTGTWWWNPWAFLAQSYTEEMKWAKDYDFYLADYAHEKPDTCLGAGRVIAHQYTSTPSPVIAGIPNGGHVDCARWLLSDTEYAIWGGGEKKLSDAEKLAKLWTAHPELH